MTSFRRDLHNRTLTYLGTSLGLVAGLAWNDAIKDLITLLFPIAANSVIAKFGYALFLTLFVGTALWALERYLRPPEEHQ